MTSTCSYSRVATRRGLRTARRPPAERRCSNGSSDGGRLVSMAGGTGWPTMLGLPRRRSPTDLRRTGFAGPRQGPARPVVRGSRRPGLELLRLRLGDDGRRRAASPIFYPTRNSPAGDWFVSGYEVGASELGGTQRSWDEAYGDGRVVAFAGEPNFRGFTDGTQKVLWNAVYGPDPKAKVTSAKSERRGRPLDRHPWGCRAHRRDAGHGTQRG